MKEKGFRPGLRVEAGEGVDNWRVGGDEGTMDVRCRSGVLSITTLILCYAGKDVAARQRKEKTERVYRTRR